LRNSVWLALAPPPRVAQNIRSGQMPLLLYVGRDKRRPERHDLGSTLCLSTLEKWEENTVVVRNATDIDARDRPFGLKGTPTLVDQDTDEWWTGFAAFEFLTTAMVKHIRAKPDAPQRGAKTQARVTEALPPGGSEQLGPAPGALDNLHNMWESQGVDDEGLSEENETGNNKFSESDFSAAVAKMARETSNAGGNLPGTMGVAPPMLKPLKE